MTTRTQETKDKISKSVSIIRTGTHHTQETKDKISKAMSDSGRKEPVYRKAINSLGMCLFCGDIDWRHLEEHHPDKIKLPDFTVTLCANCHADLHWNKGSYSGYKKK